MFLVKHQKFYSTDFFSMQGGSYSVKINQFEYPAFFSEIEFQISPQIKRHKFYRHKYTEALNVKKRSNFDSKMNKP